MKNRLKKAIALLMIVTMSLLTLASCGSSDSADTTTTSSSDGITIFNSKMEVQDQMLEMAKKYTKETGVKVEVYYSGDTVSAHLATKYASHTPYTISMVDPKDVYSLAEEHAADLSDQKWVNETDYALKVGDKVYGFPVCIEARGIIYNADAIEKITGEDFDPSDYKTLTAFKKLLKELKAGGMKYPCGIMKEDWSLGAHYLAEVYEQRDDPDAFVRGLSDGSIDLNSDAKFNSMMDTWEVLMANNYAKDSAISAEREVTEQKLAEGEIAFMFGGNWDWSVINAYDYTTNMGIMPVPQNTNDGTNEELVGGPSKVFFVDSSEDTTDEQRQEAYDFLNWLVYNKEGQSFIVNDCSMVSPFKNNPYEVTDPLGQSVQKYANAGKLIGNYNFLPDDHYAILGAQFQKYLAGMCTREEFGDEVQKYWKTKTLEVHED